MKKNTIALLILSLACNFILAQTPPSEYFEGITWAELKDYPLSSQRLNGIEKALPEGAILIYETNEHRKGKLWIRQYGYNLLIDWVTYAPSGRIYAAGTASALRGTYTFDLDGEGDAAKGADCWWEQVDGTQRYWVPQNGAKFAPYRSGEAENDGNIYPYPLHKVKLRGGVEVAYADEGSGTSTLLFVHGLGGYHQVWKKILDSLQGQYRCIAIDLPGCGRSSKGEYDFSVRFYSDVLIEFIERLRLENVALIGHSYGGQIAAATASRQVPAVKRLVLLAPSGLAVLYEWQKNQYEEKVLPEKIKSTSDNDLRIAFNKSYVSGKMPKDAEFMLNYRLNIKKRPDYFDYFCQMSYKMSMAVINELVLDQLPTIKVPTLVLWGKEDKLIFPKLAKEAETRIPKCAVRYLSSCGHMLLWECAGSVHMALREFVSNQPPQPVALFEPEPKPLIAPCTIRFINHSRNAERYVWMVNDKMVGEAKDLVYTFKTSNGYRIKLIAWNGDQSDEYEKNIRILGE